MNSEAYPIVWDFRAICIVRGLTGRALLLSNLVLPLVFQSRKVGPANFVIDHSKDLIASSRDRSSCATRWFLVCSGLRILRRAFCGAAGEQVGARRRTAQPGRRVAVDLGNRLGHRGRAVVIVFKGGAWEKSDHCFPVRPKLLMSRVRGAPRFFGSSELLCPPDLRSSFNHRYLKSFNSHHELAGNQHGRSAGSA